ncbi:hypothetical protein C0J52_27726 [Blattella germanica]|nr:hypothetical protein C0J52_27726 [Blattella germanica]
MLSFTHKEVDSSDDDEDGQDAECIYCSRIFSKDSLIKVERSKRSVFLDIRQRSFLFADL